MKNFKLETNGELVGEVSGEGDVLILTKYIKENEIAVGKKLSLVKDHRIKEVISYAGYLTVNETWNSNMFFWYFPAENNSDTAPLVLWLQGGPGVSSLNSVFAAHGPFIINSNLELDFRYYSWHLTHNVLYIDNPVGVGFSFTDDEAGYSTNQVEIGINLLSAINQFLTLFSDLRSNKLFLIGESYAGKYIPALGLAILEHNKYSPEKINLQGLVIGSGLIDPITQIDYGIYLYHMGLIDTHGLRKFEDCQNTIKECIQKKNFVCAFDHVDKLILKMNYKYDSIYTNLTGLHSIYNILDTFPDDEKVAQFLYHTDFKQSLHVGSIEFNKNGRIVQTKLINDIMDSVSEWFAILLSHYKVFLFNGQFDVLVGHSMTENFINNLKFDGADEYKLAKRHVWKVEGEIAGYVKEAGNLTHIFIRNAGHFCAADQPKWVLDMLQKITSGPGFK